MDNKCDMGMALVVSMWILVAEGLRHWWPSGLSWFWGITLVGLLYENWYRRAKAKARRDLFDAMTPKGPRNNY
jgi:hypothetical protein